LRVPESDEADLALLAEAAREAGGIAMRYFGASPEVWMKSGDSPVSEADLSVDRFLSDALLGARPDYGWLSEETAGAPRPSAKGPIFVVDPIDGTRAFLEGKPTWCVSIAVVAEGRPVAGVLACPAREEVYSARRGKGAALNGTELSVGAARRPLRVAGPRPMVAGLPKSRFGAVEIQPYIPSLAYRIAMVASGAIDATFVKPNAHEWDLAAADLILEEAGGSVLDEKGDRLVYAGSRNRHGTLVAGSGELLLRLHRHLMSERPDGEPV
jgi:myo-inositol-1(or 4)-monophosphatase